MKIIMLLANYHHEHLNSLVKVITQVLKELEVEVQIEDLSKLPYFAESQDSFMDKLIQEIEESNGVIILSPIYMLGVHGAIQNFFDHATRYSALQKPALTITYGEWFGESEAGEHIVRAWHVLGGIATGKLCLNGNSTLEIIKERVEKTIEDFYRAIKQDRIEIPSSERILYENYRSKKQIAIQSPVREESSPIKEEKQIRPFVELLRSEKVEEKPTTTASFIDVSTKEQNIQEITSLLKQQFGKKEEPEFVAMENSIYTKPTGRPLIKPNDKKKLQHMPHYFIAQYDKDLSVIVQYIVADKGEAGYLVIAEGDCIYKEGMTEAPTVEITVVESILEDILTKKITYQKAFMLGKLKVRGNFAILSKLDQVFKAI